MERSGIRGPMHAESDPGFRFAPSGLLARIEGGRQQQAGAADGAGEIDPADAGGEGQAARGEAGHPPFQAPVELHLAPLSLWVTLAVTVYSGIEYFVRFGRLIVGSQGGQGGQPAPPTAS